MEKLVSSFKKALALALSLALPSSPVAAQVGRGMVGPIAPSGGLPNGLAPAQLDQAFLSILDSLPQDTSLWPSTLQDLWSRYQPQTSLSEIDAILPMALAFHVLSQGQVSMETLTQWGLPDETVRGVVKLWDTSKQSPEMSQVMGQIQKELREIGQGRIELPSPTPSQVFPSLEALEGRPWDRPMGEGVVRVEVQEQGRVLWFQDSGKSVTPLHGSVLAKAPAPGRRWEKLPPGARLLKKRPAPIKVSLATKRDIPGIVAVAREVALENQKDVPSEKKSLRGFLISAYGRKEYDSYLNSPYTTVVVARNEKGRVLGFALYYTKELINPKDPAQELNYLARKAVEKQYGKETTMAVAKQIAVTYGSEGRGVSSFIRDFIKQDLREKGIDFLFVAVVDDQALIGTEFNVDGAIFFRNRISMLFNLTNGFKRLVDGFLYSHELELMRMNPDALPSGIHSRTLLGIAANPGKPLPGIAVPRKNLPSTYSSSRSPGVPGAEAEERGPWPPHGFAESFAEGILRYIYYQAWMAARVPAALTLISSLLLGVIVTALVFWPQAVADPADLATQVPILAVLLLMNAEALVFWLKKSKQVESREAYRTFMRLSSEQLGSRIRLLSGLRLANLILIPALVGTYLVLRYFFGSVDGGAIIVSVFVMTEWTQYNLYVLRSYLTGKQVKGGIYGQEVQRLKSILRKRRVSHGGKGSVSAPM